MSFLRSFFILIILVVGYFFTKIRSCASALHSPRTFAAFILAVIVYMFFRLLWQLLHYLADPKGFAKRRESRVFFPSETATLANRGITRSLVGWRTVQEYVAHLIDLDVEVDVPGEGVKPIKQAMLRKMSTDPLSEPRDLVNDILGLLRRTPVVRQFHDNVMSIFAPVDRSKDVHLVSLREGATEPHELTFDDVVSRLKDVIAKKAADGCYEVRIADVFKDYAVMRDLSTVDLTQIGIERKRRNPHCFMFTRWFYTVLDRLADSSAFCRAMCCLPPFQYSEDDIHAPLRPPGNDTQDTAPEPVEMTTFSFTRRAEPEHTLRPLRINERRVVTHDLSRHLIDWIVFDQMLVVQGNSIFIDIARRAQYNATETKTQKPQESDSDDSYDKMSASGSEQRVETGDLVPRELESLWFKGLERCLASFLADNPDIKTEIHGNILSGMLQMVTGPKSEQVSIIVEPVPLVLDIDFSLTRERPPDSEIAIQIYQRMMDSHVAKMRFLIICMTGRQLVFRESIDSSVAAQEFELPLRQWSVLNYVPNAAKRLRKRYWFKIYGNMRQRYSFGIAIARNDMAMINLKATQGVDMRLQGPRPKITWF